MRENTHRNGSNFRDRGDNRSGQGKPPRSQAPRSKRSVNLGRLGTELGLDVLGAALGLTNEALQILVDGRDHAREEQYAAHLTMRLKDAGVSVGWLERPYSPLAPEYVQRLREFAAAAPNKAPIRRLNFSRLAQIFADRLEVLADALEMIPASITNVSEGRLECDDYRFSHINPRLMRAGFPDGWLEQSSPDLTDSMVLALEQLATDEYERHLTDVDDEDLHHNAASQAYVSPVPAQVAAVASSTLQEAAPIEMSKETEMASANSPQNKTATTPAVSTQDAPSFPAAGMPGATRPMPHPSAAAAGAKLPRSVLAAGRKLGGAAPAPAPAPAPAARATAAAAPTGNKKKAENKPVPVAAVQAEAERRTPAPRGTITKEVSAVRADALETLLETTARRGVRVALWRDILGSSLPFWGNIRRGTVLFRDDLADGVVKAMGLPSGWLDNPSFPPATLAAWVTDASAPVPTALEIMGTPATAATVTAKPATASPVAGKREPATINPAKPFSRTSGSTGPTATMTTPPAAPPVFVAKAAETTPAAQSPATAIAAVADAPVAVTETSAVVATVAEPVVAEPVAAAVSAAPAAIEAAPVAAAHTLPASAPGHVGPLCQALLTILSERAAAGSFSELDALAMINSLVKP